MHSPYLLHAWCLTYPAQLALLLLARFATIVSTSIKVQEDKQDFVGFYEHASHRKWKEKEILDKKDTGDSTNEINNKPKVLLE